MKYKIFQFLYLSSLQLFLSVLPSAFAVTPEGGQGAGGSEIVQPLIDLDAAGVSPGEVRIWKNSGTLGGEFAAESGNAPVEANVGGRQAVTFGDGHFLVSSFSAPLDLTGAKSFSVAAWAFLPARVNRDVLVSWSSRPLNTAEFGYGAGPDGAFFGWDKAARFEHLPSTGQWHHIAWSSDTHELLVYVDGILNTRREMAIAPKPGGHIQIGSGWNSVDQKPIAFLHGSLARVQIWNRALSQRELRNAAGWTSPFNANPQDHAVVAPEEAVLRWEAGSGLAKSFAVRIAPDELAAENPAAHPDDIRTAAAEVHLPNVAPGTSYFWRVDQLDDSGKLICKGPVWQFTVDNGPATKPYPRDEVAGVHQSLKELKWTPGRYAKSQAVYLSTNKDAVERGSTALASNLDAAAANCAIPATALEYGKTYYWRVAENNGGIASAKGAVWTFRTEDVAIADDVTFFVGSDTHYGLGNNDELNRRVIDEMNRLPGTPLPPEVGGGTVRTPRGLILDGDLLDKGFDPKTAPANWAEFVQDYGLEGDDGRLAYPVFEGFGNHDGMTGVSVSREGIRQRNKIRKGLTMVSANGFHYSWDWDQVHLVQLNLFPGKDSTDCIVGPPNHNPENSIGFMEEDLAKNVGSSGRIVIVFCHYCYSGGMADWWTPSAKDRFFAALKGYRVILIHGHSHGAYFYEWKGLRAISDGSTARPESQTGDFLVVHLTNNELTIAQRKIGEWGITLKEPLPGVTPAADPAPTPPMKVKTQP